MKRSRAPSALAASSQTVTTTKVTKKAKPQQNFRVPRWAGKTKTGFPKELRMKHRYVDTYTLASTAGAINSESYSCNGMFDPYLSAGGHQPFYFDQLAAIYNHYTVLNSKITYRVSMSAFGGSTVGPVNCVLYINDDTTVTPATMSAQMEQSSSNYGACTPDNQIVLKKSWSAKENFGPGAISDPNLQGTGAANPTEQQAFTFSIQSADIAATTGVWIQVTVEYDAVWQELKDIAAS